MDTEHTLRSALGRLCLEYQGLAYIVHHYLHDERPLRLLNEYCSLTANKSRVAKLLDEILAHPQYDESNPQLAAALINMCETARERLQFPPTNPLR